jgi:hypothetical protein
MSEPIQPQQATQSESAIDPLILQAAMQRIRNEQNLVMAAVAGAAAALLGGCAWAAITVTTNFQIGWMAVGVGFLVGYAVKIFGKGIDRSFGFAGGLRRGKLAHGGRHHRQTAKHSDHEYFRKARR